MKSIFLFLTLAAGHLIAQSAEDLPGSAWQGINPATEDTLRIEFGQNDTIYLEDSLVRDIPVAHYDIVAGQLNFTDLAEGSICDVTPATYNISIDEDSLKFKVVADLCQDRVDILTSYQWARSERKVHGEKRRGEISIYPSPDEMSIYLKLPAWFDRSEYKIFRLSQQLMQEGEITSDNPKIDVSGIPKGNYILFLDINQKTYRLVIDNYLMK